MRKLLIMIKRFGWVKLIYRICLLTWLIYMIIKAFQGV